MFPALLTRTSFRSNRSMIFDRIRLTAVSRLLVESRALKKISIRQQKLPSEKFGNRHLTGCPYGTNSARSGQNHALSKSPECNTIILPQNSYFVNRKSKISPINFALISEPVIIGSLKLSNNRIACSISYEYKFLLMNFS